MQCINHANFLYFSVIELLLNATCILYAVLFILGNDSSQQNRYSEKHFRFSKQTALLFSLSLIKIRTNSPQTTEEINEKKPKVFCW